MGRRILPTATETQAGGRRCQTTQRTKQFVKLEMPRFENGRPLLIAGLGGRYTADTLDIFSRSGSASRFTSAEYADGYGVLPIAPAPTCAPGRAVSTTWRVWKFPILQPFQKTSASWLYQRRDTLYFRTGRMSRRFATPSIGSGHSGSRPRTTRPLVRPMALRISLNDTASTSIHTSEPGISRSGSNRPLDQAQK